MRFQHTCILKTIRFTTQDCYIQKWFLIRDLKGFIFKRIFKEYNLRLKNKQFIEQISMAGLLIERSMCFRLALQTNYDREISQLWECVVLGGQITKLVSYKQGKPLASVHAKRWLAVGLLENHLDCRETVVGSSKIDFRDFSPNFYFNQILELALQVYSVVS